MSYPFAPKIIRPQPGPQEQFLASPADIVIYGGGAGGGKTWGLLLEPLRHVRNPGFGAVFFRRNTKQVKNEGGLWDESLKLYQPLGAIPKESTADWKFPSGATVSFSHLEHEKTKFDWQGSQIPLICFDELTHFTAGQFWYLVSRNRSMCGVRPYIRATTNPDPDSWVAKLIEWWIDQKTGYPIPERSGVVRWFVRIGDDIKWADRPEDLAEYKMPDPDDPASGNMVPIPPKSLTFIQSLVTDNKELMKANPDYVANLMAQGSVQRERLMKGNWKIKASDGLFKRGWFEVKDVAPRLLRIVRGWDFAATEVEDDGTLKVAATASVKMGVDDVGNYWVLDATTDRLGPDGVMRLLKNTASRDGRTVVGSIPQDPGQAGKAQVKIMIKSLPGYKYYSSPESGDKILRASPFAAQAEAGNVYLVRGAWNDAFLDELEAFPSSEIKDQVDAASRAFNEIAANNKYRFEINL